MNIYKNKLGWIPNFAERGSVKLQNIYNQLEYTKIDDFDEVGVAQMVGNFMLYFLGRTISVTSEIQYIYGVFLH